MAAQSKGQFGFSLVELMVAMVLGLLIVGAVLQTFLAGKRSYAMQEDLSRIQENGRFAMEFLKRDIRAADFWGCTTGMTGKITNHLNSGANYTPDASKGVYGIDGAASNPQSYGASFGSDSIYSDVIQISGGETQAYVVVEPYMPNTGGALHVSHAHPGIPKLEQGDIVFVSDCSAGEIFQVANPAGGGGSGGSGSKYPINHVTGNSVSPGNASKDFSKKYQGDARVFKASFKSFHIGENDAHEPALYRTVTGKNSEELVEGVESMQLRYGVDTDGDNTPNFYQTAAEINAATSYSMQDVISVQISLLLRGFDNVTDKPVTFEYNDTPLTASDGDRRLRKVFTSTVAIRNRLK